MDNYEIKEIKGSDIVEYSKLLSIMFKAKMFGLDNEEECIKATEEAAKKRADEIVRIGAFYDGSIYAGINSWGFVGIFDGNDCKINGIGGVVSHFNSPQKGAISQIFTKAFEIMREKGQYISHLYPFDETYYRQFGYDISADTALWKIGVEKLLVKRDGITVPYDGTEKMKEHIKHIHVAFSKKHNLSVYKSEPMWSGFFDSIKPYESGINSFVHYNNNGEPDAFMNYTLATFDNKPADINVNNLWFTSLGALTGVLSYFGTQRSYCDMINITIPTYIDLSPVINAKGKNGKRISDRIVKNCGMSRVVDVEKILSMAKYKGEGSICIKIYDDEYAPWNNDTYTINYGKEVAVTRGGIPDIEMKINSFSAGILGRLDFENMALFDDIKIINEKPFENIFYKKPMFILERI